MLVWVFRFLRYNDMASDFFIRQLLAYTRILAWIAILFFIFTPPAPAQSPGVGQAAYQWPESARLLSAYLGIPSISGNEGRAGRYLSDLCRQYNLHVEVFSEEEHNYNFAASLYPLESSLPNIIFLNHIDVVGAGSEEDWTHPPFSGAIQDSMVWGRGAIDMKSMAIMQLLALSRFKAQHSDEPLPFNATLLSVSAEEVISPYGAGWVVENFFDLLNPVAVYGEGGAGVYGLISRDEEKPVMCVSIADKKALWFELTFDEPGSGHGAIPPPHYANQTALRRLDILLGQRPKIRLSDCAKEFFTELGKMEGGVRGFVLRNSGFFKPLIAGRLRKQPMVMAAVSNTMVLTNLNNPDGAFNQIAQKTVAQFDCRLLPGTDSEHFLQKIRTGLKPGPWSLEVLGESQEADASDTGMHYQLLVNALRTEYPEAAVLPVLFPAITDNNFFRNRGVPTYGIHPVIFSTELLQTIHNTDERIPVQSLERGLRVYINLLNGAFNYHHKEAAGQPLARKKQKKPGI